MRVYMFNELYHRSMHYYYTHTHTHMYIVCEAAISTHALLLPASAVCSVLILLHPTHHFATTKDFNSRLLHTLHFGYFRFLRHL